jgi:hypothetical protein
VTTDRPASIPEWPALKRNYALGTVLIGGLAMVLCGAVTAVLGGDGQAIVIASSALAVGLGLSLAPVLVGVRMEGFGMAVVAASGARLLVALGIVVIAAVSMDLPRRPIGLGVGAGLLLSLVAETILAMAILSRVNRKTELA